MQDAQLRWSIHSQALYLNVRFQYEADIRLEILNLHYRQSTQYADTIMVFFVHARNLLGRAHYEKTITDASWFILRGM